MIKFVVNADTDGQVELRDTDMEYLTEQGYSDKDFDEENCLVLDAGTFKTVREGLWNFRLKTRMR